MKAVIFTKYGKPEVLKIKEMTKPAPKDDEVCITIHASAVTASDIFIRSSPLDEIVEAHRYVEKGHKKGGVAITVN